MTFSSKLGVTSIPGLRIRFGVQIRYFMCDIWYMGIVKGKESEIETSCTVTFVLLY